MSRSYKKVAAYTDHNRGTWARKRFASKAVRRKTNELVNGKMYKKIWETWSICDFRFIYEYKYSHLDVETAIARRK
jgi:hypothetical protein